MVRLATPKEIAKRIFRVRSFKGQSPEVLRRRFQLATGLIRDVTKGRITLKTALLFAKEGYDSLLKSPFLVVGETAPGRRRSRARQKTAAAVKKSIAAPPPEVPEIGLPRTPPGLPQPADHTLWRAELQFRHMGRTRRF